jgi:hypothetical protein
MTTVHGYDSLPPSEIEVYLSPDELKPGAFYEVKSDYLERIAYCVDHEHFFGLHIEDRQGVFSIRLSREPHITHCDKNGINSGSRPVNEFTLRNTSYLPKNYGGSDLTHLLVQHSLEYYNELYQNLHQYPEQEDLIATKLTLFSTIMNGWQKNTLPQPDDHGYLNIASLKQALN